MTKRKATVAKQNVDPTAPAPFVAPAPLVTAPLVGSMVHYYHTHAMGGPGPFAAIVTAVEGTEVTLHVIEPEQVPYVRGGVPMSSLDDDNSPARFWTWPRSF